MTISCNHITIGGAHICIQTTVLYGCYFANGYINILRLSCFYITFCGQLKHILRLRVCSTFTIITSEHEIILMISANVCISSSSASALGLSLSGALLWAPNFYFAGLLSVQRYCNFLETVVPVLLEDVPLSVRRRLRFKHDGAPAHYGLHVR
jgi:hypothetical protein